MNSVGVARRDSLYHVHSASSAGNKTQVQKKAWIRRCMPEELTSRERIKGKEWRNTCTELLSNVWMRSRPHQAQGQPNGNWKGNHNLSCAGSEL